MALDAKETEIRDRLHAARDSMVTRVAEMVAIPSGHGHREGLERLQSMIATRLRALGAVVEMVPTEARPAWIDPRPSTDARVATLVARRLEGRGGPRMLLCGHVDTVHDPAGAFQRLEPRGDGAMTGPGAVDMKGGLEVLLSALEALEAADLVARSSAPSSGRGRPPTHWSLTPAAGALFADRHADLSVDLIDAVRTTLGEPALAAVIAARVDRQAHQYAQAVSPAAPVAERVEVLARLRNAEGYLAEVVDDQHGLGLVEHHCPIRGAAEACDDLCDAELDLFRKVLGPDVAVEREQHLLRSDQRCAYRISPR